MPSLTSTQTRSANNTPLYVPTDGSGSSIVPSNLTVNGLLRSKGGLAVGNGTPFDGNSASVAGRIVVGDTVIAGSVSTVGGGVIRSLGGLAVGNGTPFDNQSAVIGGRVDVGDSITAVGSITASNFNSPSVSFTVPAGGTYVVDPALINLGGAGIIALCVTAQNRTTADGTDRYFGGLLVGVRNLPDSVNWDKISYFPNPTSGLVVGFSYNGTPSPRLTISSFPESKWTISYTYLAFTPYVAYPP